MYLIYRRSVGSIWYKTKTQFMWLPPPAVINHNIIDRGPSRRRRRAGAERDRRRLTRSRTLVEIQITQHQKVDNLPCTFKYNSSRYNFLFSLVCNLWVQCVHAARPTPSHYRYMLYFVLAQVDNQASRGERRALSWSRARRGRGRQRRVVASFRLEQHFTIFK